MQLRRKHALRAFGVRFDGEDSPIDETMPFPAEESTMAGKKCKPRKGKKGDY